MSERKPFTPPETEKGVPVPKHQGVLGPRALFVEAMELDSSFLIPHGAKNEINLYRSALAALRRRDSKLYFTLTFRQVDEGVRVWKVKASKDAPPRSRR